LFYWTPDLPEIVVKQAQEIKRCAEQSPYVKQRISNPGHIGEMRSILHPIIYPSYITIPFTAGKANVGSIKRPMDGWFWNSGESALTQNYLEGIEYLNQNINKLYFSGGEDIYHGGYTCMASNYYRL
jgi:hypothetical protein